MSTQTPSRDSAKTPSTSAVGSKSTGLNATPQAITTSKLIAVEDCTSPYKGSLYRLWTANES